ncbi:MAG: substrate-binding domain-containing protein, partial [Pseudomonadota bacterium]
MSKKMRNRAFGLTALASLMMTAPAYADEYGILMKTLANPFWGAMGEGVEEGAKGSGVDYYIQAVESDQAAESQLNVCNTMLERSPVAMITAAINSTNLLPCLKKAQESGIKVVDLDGNLDPAILDAEGVDITFSIGSDNVLAGAQGAEYMV